VILTADVGGGVYFLGLMLAATTVISRREYTLKERLPGSLGGNRSPNNLR
jgi:hypothetical protein